VKWESLLEQMLNKPYAKRRSERKNHVRVEKKETGYTRSGRVTPTVSQTGSWNEGPKGFSYIYFKSVINQSKFGKIMGVRDVPGRKGKGRFPTSCTHSNAKNIRRDEMYYAARY